MRINRFNVSQMSNHEIASLCRRSELDIQSYRQSVQPIIDDVRVHGNQAIVEYTAQLDKVNVDIGSIKVTEREFEEAEACLDMTMKEVIQRSAKNIRQFHEAQMPKATWFEQIEPGILAGEKITPIASIGLYVPRGKGSFPSVMLMLCIPASVTKVPHVAVCTPPTPQGTVDHASLFAAQVRV